MAGLYACGGMSEEEKAKAQAEAETAVNEMMDDLEAAMDETTEESSKDMLAEHVCSDKCTADACHLKHGEKGHACGEDCAAMEGEHDHDHDHDHDHSEDEGSEE
ncbi:MAG: hypothetical protein COA57_01350 [Flavobacteriales bacterium]|nr:MAG: hypothetical protein COA57_01350 [Flavobacteriales bacterium]